MKRQPALVAPGRDVSPKRPSTSNGPANRRGGSRSLILALALASGIAHLPAFAQETKLKPFRPDDDRPVMRAQPVPKPVPVPEVPTATPIPRATPVMRAVPVPRATPIPKATPKPTPIPTPEMADPTGEIRLTPQATMTAEQVQLSIADGYYARKSFDLAAAEYEKYLGLYPAAPERANVLYRLGESYRATGAVNAAKNSYETLLSQFGSSELIGPAAYRLAELYYQDKNYVAAVPLYRRASVRLRDPKLANSAKFFTARSLEAQNKKMDARVVYEDLVGSPNDNPFLDASRLSLALLLKDANRTADALKQVQALAKQTTNDELKAQATVYSGLWELELDRPGRAADDLKKALAMPGVGRWKDIAELGLAQLYFNEGKYKQVIETFESLSKDLTPETRPQILNLVAKAYRQLGKHAEAVSHFDEVILDFPNSLYAKEAMFERLVCLYTSNDPDLVTQIDNYLIANPEAQKRDQVMLMKAEMLFKKPDYAAAGPIYAVVAESKTLTGVLLAEALYKAGLCQLENRDLDAAIKTFTRLAERFPTYKALPAAICRRGLARLRLNDLTGALADFNFVIEKHPKTTERELSLYQKAKILGKQGDNTGMAEAFKLLLTDYPNTPEAADASYWIGWVAFENKDYKSAPEPLDRARQLNREEYFERASLRIMLSYFYLENKEALGREIDLYRRSDPKGQVPYEVLHWLGHGYYEQAAAAEKTDTRIEFLNNAAKYLAMLTVREDAKPDDFLNLGRCTLSLGEFQKSQDALQKYLGLVKEPVPRVVGLLSLGQAQIGLKQLDPAQGSADEALSLQPDGEFNAKARVLAGDIQTARGSHEEAAKIYESVSAVIDDESITPKALEKAIEAYKQAGRDADARRLLNTLQSRYPEYFQRKNAAP